MKLSQIKKKYPKAWAKFWKSVTKGWGYISPTAEKVETNYHGEKDIRSFYASIVDHFDRLGIFLESESIKPDKKTVFFCSVTIDGVSSCEMVGNYNGYKSRYAAESVGLTKLFEIREKQLKLKS